MSVHRYGSTSKTLKPVKASPASALASLGRVASGDFDDPPTAADLTLLREAGLVHDYTHHDSYKGDWLERDSLTGEGKTLWMNISDARRNEKDLRDRLDAIAAEMDRAWRGSRNEYAPMSNVATHPAWKHWSAELKKATRKRMQAEAAAVKRIRRKKSA